MGIKIDPTQYFNITKFLLKREVPVFICEGLLRTILELLFTPNKIRASFTNKLWYLCRQGCKKYYEVLHKNMLQVVKRLFDIFKWIWLSYCNCARVLSNMQLAAPTTDTLSLPITAITASVVRQYRVLAGGFP